MDDDREKQLTSLKEMDKANPQTCSSAVTKGL
jgi:hypothetical protein